MFPASSSCPRSPGLPRGQETSVVGYKSHDHAPLFKNSVRTSPSSNQHASALVLQLIHNTALFLFSWLLPSSCQSRPDTSYLALFLLFQLSGHLAPKGFPRVFQERQASHQGTSVRKSSQCAASSQKESMVSLPLSRVKSGERYIGSLVS